MVFSVIGGDARSVHLVRRLLRDGHQVQCFGLDTADLPSHCRKAQLQDALSHTQCVILPIPATDGSGLRTPLSQSHLSIQALTADLPPAVPVFCGAATEALVTACGSKGCPLQDLLAYEPFNIQNAALTAQAALLFLDRKCPHKLQNLTILILGGGRIGRLLGLQLTRQGAKVTVAARNSENRAWCRALGLGTETLSRLPALLPETSLVVNTVPAQILHTALLRQLPSEAVLLELASAPGGFDPRAAEEAGHTVLRGGGLPGRFLPQSAADAIAETVYDLLKVR